MKLYINGLKTDIRNILWIGMSLIRCEDDFVLIYCNDWRGIAGKYQEEIMKRFENYNRHEYDDSIVFGYGEEGIAFTSLDSAYEADYMIYVEEGNAQ